MAFKFKTLLKQSTVERMEREDAELLRLYDMPDRFLARSLLTYARRAREAHPTKFSLDFNDGWHYGKELVWNLVPEIAYRLGETCILPNERRGKVQTLSDLELRNYAFNCVTCSEHFAYDEHGLIDPYNFLLHSIPNGNLIAIAVDRISPPLEFDRDDKFAAHIHEISAVRGFDPPLLAWEPAMQDYEIDREARRATITDSILRATL